MRTDSGYKILEAEDLEDGVSLTEVNESLKQEGLKDTFIVDTRVSAIDGKSSGYNGNLMLYSQNKMVSREDTVSSVLADYFEQKDITLSYTGEGFEDKYYNILNL